MTAAASDDVLRERVRRMGQEVDDHHRRLNSIRSAQIEAIGASGKNGRLSRAEQDIRKVDAAQEQGLRNLEAAQDSVEKELAEIRAGYGVMAVKMAIYTAASSGVAAALVAALVSWLLTRS